MIAQKCLSISLSYSDEQMRRKSNNLQKNFESFLSCILFSHNCSNWFGNDHIRRTYIVRFGFFKWCFQQECQRYYEKFAVLCLPQYSMFFNRLSERQSFSSSALSNPKKGQQSANSSMNVEAMSTPSFSSADACCSERLTNKGISVPNIDNTKGIVSRKKQANICSHPISPWRLFSRKKFNSESPVVSTTCLIFETRPSNLPAKSEEEEMRQRAQYEEMIEQAKKRGAREANERKKAAECQKKLEDQASAACRIWCETILPRWEEMKNTRKCRDLWWQGLPPKIRGKVWSLVIGNSLNLTIDLYEICCNRALEHLSAKKLNSCEMSVTNNVNDVCKPPAVSATEECVNRENTLELISLDISRTFPTLGIFQEGGPFYDILLKLLGAYVCYRPDVGYVQSMSFIAAVLLLQMDAYEAFVAFSNLLNCPLQLAFYRLLQPQMIEYFIAYDQFFDQELHKLHSHFDALNVRPDLYLIEWIYTLYAKSLPLDVTCRVWDMYLRDGEEFLFQTALGILRLYESSLLDMDFDGIIHFLTHLPESITSAELFRSIGCLMHLQSSASETGNSKKGFQQILSDVNQRVNPGHVFDVSCAVYDLSHYPIRNDCDWMSKPSQLSQLSSNVKRLKMSKSLSEFLGDLLKPPPSLSSFKPVSSEHQSKTTTSVNKMRLSSEATMSAPLP